MPARSAGVIGAKILLGHVGDVGGAVVLRQQVIVGLILARANLLRDRVPPLVAVVERGIDLVDDAAKWIVAMLHDLADTELRTSLPHLGLLLLFACADA